MDCLDAGLEWCEDEILKNFKEMKDAGVGVQGLDTTMSPNVSGPFIHSSSFI